MNSKIPKKRVVFIEPSGSASSVFENYLRLPLVGCLTLGTILHESGYDVRIYCENLLPDGIDPFSLHADVFCVTSLSVNSPRAKQLAAQIRSIYPASRIIIGGIHATLMPKDFEGLADYIVQGEAESIIVDLVEGKLPGPLVRSSTLHDIEQLPLLNYQLIENVESMQIIPIMTSRGCPFDCNFCSVTLVFGKRFRMQSARRVVDEVKNALHFFSTRNVFFYDDNFSANKQRVYDICNLLIAEKVDINWTAQVRADIANDPKLLSAMASAGCRWFYIGFESISDETLAAYHKSQTRADIERAIVAIHEAGINIHGMFIFGDDGDTVETMRKTVDFALHHEIDTVQFMILTPFPGTRLYERVVKEGRLLHQRWEYFDGMYAVQRPTAMSPLVLQRETLNAYKRFYSLWRVVLEAMKLMLTMSLDVFSLNFKRAQRYGFDSIFLRAGGGYIVNKHASRFQSYIKFLSTLEMEGNAAPRTTISST